MLCLDGVMMVCFDGVMSGCAVFGWCVLMVF